MEKILGAIECNSGKEIAYRYKFRTNTAVLKAHRPFQNSGRRFLIGGNTELLPISATPMTTFALPRVPNIIARRKAVHAGGDRLARTVSGLSPIRLPLKPGHRASGLISGRFNKCSRTYFHPKTIRNRRVPLQGDTRKTLTGNLPREASCSLGR